MEYIGGSSLSAQTVLGKCWWRQLSTPIVVKFIAVIAPPFFIFLCIVLKNSAINKLVLVCIQFVAT